MTNKTAYINFETRITTLKYQYYIIIILFLSKNQNNQSNF